MSELPTVAALKTRKGILVAYLKMKLDAEDWHAVQDAASDIRELDAQIEMLHRFQLP